MVAVGGALVEHAQIGCAIGRQGGVGVVEVDQLAPVRETVDALGDGTHEASVDRFRNRKQFFFRIDKMWPSDTMEV